jgi:hypothetical protein
MAKDDNGDLGAEYDRNSRLSHIFGYVLIGGLFLELINGLIWFRGSETVAGIIAVLLIVGGVWGEIFFAHRARVAGDRQLAKYESNAAEALRETERLRNENLKLQLRLAPRTLSKAQSDVLQSLKGKVPAINLAAEVDGEADAFMVQIANALEAAGIFVGVYSRDASVRGWGNMVCVVRDPVKDPSPVLDLLVETFNAAGIPIKQPASWLPSDLKSAPADVPMICIGIKSWPDAEVKAAVPVVNQTRPYW